MLQEQATLSGRRRLRGIRIFGAGLVQVGRVRWRALLMPELSAIRMYVALQLSLFMGWLIIDTCSGWRGYSQSYK